MDEDNKPLHNDPLMNPFQQQIMYQYADNYKWRIGLFVVMSLLFSIAMPYVCIGIAYLIRLTNIQIWFYEHPMTRIISLFVFLSLTGVGYFFWEKEKSFFFDLLILIQIIPVSFVLVILGPSTFNVLYQTVICSILLVLLCFLWLRDMENFYMNKKVTFIIAIIPIFYYMYQENVIQIQDGVLIYQINSLVGHLLICSYCFCSALGVKTVFGFCNAFGIVSPPKTDAWELKDQLTYWKIRYMILSTPFAFGAYIGSIFSLLHLPPIEHDICDSFLKKITSMIYRKKTHER